MLLQHEILPVAGVLQVRGENARAVLGSERPGWAGEGLCFCILAHPRGAAN